MKKELIETIEPVSYTHRDVYKRQEILIPSGMEEMGPVTKKLYDTLTGIQMGRIEAPEGWIKRIL